jgi:signal peptidase
LGESLREYAKYLIFFIALTAAVFGGVQILRYTLKTQYPIMVVVSQSMIPTLGVGDFIIVDHIDDFGEVSAAPQPDGDILVFLKLSSSDEYIVHRAVRKYSKDGSWFYVTKGDNNHVEDSHPVPENRVIGKVVGKIPTLGFFPLFIKTSRGFALVIFLMALVFFADYIMPNKRSEETGGRFPFASLIPFLATPMVYLIFWFAHDSHLYIELLALALWYLGCIIAPLSFEDDDLGLMFWLYHFVLSVIPLGCDIVWRTTGITPSMWWYVEGSTVPITWLLQKETPMYYQAFSQFSMMLLPGCALFMVITAAKRRGVQQLVTLSRWMRRAPRE